MSLGDHQSLPKKFNQKFEKPRRENVVFENLDRKKWLVFRV